MSKSSTWRWLLALLLVTLVVFSYSAAERWQYLDDMGTWGLQWLTSFTAKVVRNWLNDGAIRDRFLMLQYPASIEFPTLLDRAPYITYLPGAAIPIWALAKVLSIHTIDALVTLIHSFNLFSQLVIAIILSFSSFLVLTRNQIGKIYAFWMSVLVSAGWLLFPSQMWWGQQVYFADQAVILPIAFLIFLEVIRKTANRKTLDWVTTLIAFWACFADWYGLVFVMVLFLKRLFQGEYRGFSWKKRMAQWLKLWSGPAVAFGIWIYQLILANGFAWAFTKLKLRTFGSQDEWCQNPITVWMPQNYGKIGTAFLLFIAFLSVFIIFYIFRHKNEQNDTISSLKDIGGLIFLVIGSAFLHLALLWQHACQHPFSTFKFGLPLAFVGFSLLPASVWLVSKNILSRRQSKWSIHRLWEAIVIPSLLFSCFLVTWLYPSWIDMGYLEFSGDTSQRWLIEDSLDQLTAFDDVVFSPDYEIDMLPPEQIARSAKCVHLALDCADMRTILDPIEGDYDVCLFYPADDPGWMSWAAGIAQEAYSVDGYTFIRINKAAWLEYLAIVTS